jgi:hypothetical protein
MYFLVEVDYNVPMLLFISEIKINILPDFEHPYSLDDVSGAISAKHCWFYDVERNDFMLKPIRLLEETTGPTVRVRINNTDINVPASWNLLVVDDETKIVDTVQITQCNSSNYLAFMMHPSESSYSLSPITLLDLYMKESCTHVMIPRMNMMLHPVGTIKNERKRTELSFSCLLSPHDLGKYMIGMTAMEVLL